VQSPRSPVLCWQWVRGGVPANSKQVEAGASRASGGLPVVLQASREGGRAQRAEGPQGGPGGWGSRGQESRLFLVWRGWGWV